MQATRLAIDETRNAKPLGETSELTKGRASLLKIDEMSGNATLQKEPQGLSGISALLRPEDLHLSAW